jgi:hypothetical protein
LGGSFGSPPWGERFEVFFASILRIESPAGFAIRREREFRTAAGGEYPREVLRTSYSLGLLNGTD